MGMSPVPVKPASPRSLKPAAVQVCWNSVGGKRRGEGRSLAWGKGRGWEGRRVAGAQGDERLSWERNETGSIPPGVLVAVRACEHVVPEVKKEEVQKQESEGTEAKRRGRKEGL